MYVLSIVGPAESGTATLVERLSERLSERGRVATVTRLERTPSIDTAGEETVRRVAGADVTYGVADESGWFAAGSDRTLEETLDDLAPSADYALVEGYSAARLPTVALGGRDHAGETLATAPDADGIDGDALVERLHERDPFETLESLVADVKRSPNAEFAGAIATFTGRVREKEGPDDAPTTHLEFDKYEDVADERMATIREELESREGVQTVRLHHRTGVVESGEDIVFVVVLAGHREEAFRTVEDGINRLKEEVTVEDSFWAHERQA